MARQGGVLSLKRILSMAGLSLIYEFCLPPAGEAERNATAPLLSESKVIANYGFM